MPAAVSHRAQHRARMAGLSVFVVAILALFLFGLSRTGANIPGFSPSLPYTFKVNLPDAENLANVSQVQIAGAQVGTIRSTRNVPGATLVDAAIEKGAGPLHQGAHVQVSQRTLVGEPILTIMDGNGAPIKSGSLLPASSVLAPVTIGTVLRDLPPATLTALGSTIRSLGAGTAGSQAAVAQLGDGLGTVGTQGNPVLTILANQSQDIKALGGELATVFDALDTGQGQFEEVVSDANQIVAATAGQQRSLAETVQQLPGLLSSAGTASGSLTQLSVALSPIAKGLQAAAPSFNQALSQLPGVTGQLNSLLPVINTTLDEAPSTLTAIPQTSTYADALIPQTQSALQNLNPMLDYLSPYSTNIVGVLGGVGAGLAHTAPDDGYPVLALEPIVTPSGLLGGLPLLGNVNTFPEDPFPAPGTLNNPTPTNKAPYTHVAKEAK